MRQVENPTLKVIVIGDSSVGKTALLLRYTEDYFSEESMPTIGLNFKTKNLNWNNFDIRLQIWDTAGQERYRIMAQTYYKGANGVILAYDCTNRNSFENISLWLDEIRENSEKQPPTILIATKTDLEDSIQVTKEEGQLKAVQLGLKFFETSSFSGKNVNDAFEGLVRDMMHRPSTYINSKSIKIEEPPTPAKQKKCCSSK